MQTSATATAALMFSSLDKISSATQPSFTMNKNYELKIMATNWGFDGNTDAFCAKVKKEGYDGIEIWWPADDKKDELFAALKKHGLENNENYSQSLEVVVKELGSHFSSRMEKYRPIYDQEKRKENIRKINNLQAEYLKKSISRKFLVLKMIYFFRFFNLLIFLEIAG